MLLIATMLLPRSHALPFSDPRGDSDTIGWVPDPSGRGTAGIIISCLLTLTLCVWSAMHLNIPPKAQSNTAYFIRGMKWVGLGILIPELVVLAAWRQWLSARRMSKELDKIFRHLAKTGSAVRRHSWTMTHSFYAGMGGFVFEQDHLPQGEGRLFQKPERLTLTGSGILLLARCGHLPDLPIQDIRDKSKADGLAKALVLLQAVWMIFQTIGRTIASQPVTLLEVNTIAHIACALVIYILWWQKPKEVHEPTILEGEWTATLAAYMFMSSRLSGAPSPHFVALKHQQTPEIARLVWLSDAASASGCNTDRDLNLTPGRLHLRPTRAQTRMHSPILDTMTSTPLDIRDPTWSSRLQACSQAISSHPAIQDTLKLDLRMGWYEPTPQHLVTDVATNWPSDYYLPGIAGELMGMALWLSSSLYGGIHIGAWSEYFPTTLEKLLWRFSATYIAGSGALWFTFCAVAFRWPWASQYWDHFIELRARRIEYVVFGLMATICGVAYIFARVFLVIDGMISLRKLQVGAYDTPNWTDIFPHL